MTLCFPGTVFLYFSQAEALGITLTEQGTLNTDAHGQTNVPGIFAAGDARLGQSLICKAIQDGRQVAKGIDQMLKAITR